MTALKLQCQVQKYAWGKIGEDSMVARLMKSAFKDYEIDNQQTYAELWMGTHPSGPAVILDEEFAGQRLSDWLEKHQGALGAEDSGTQLPFLLKVLSVHKALSIQAHPNKAHAALLHQQLPDKYPDANHKPEMAIALTPFEALCGFRPLAQIQAFIKDVPEFQRAVGEKGVDFLLSNQGEPREALRQCFTALMEGSENHILLAQLHERLDKGKAGSQPEGETRELFLRLYSQFPGDVGCFGVFFFNFIRLQPGQAIFLAANEPHAYLSGDCVECMACSDNVVRAGLTPKWKDVSTLCQMLTYRMKPKEDNIFSPFSDLSDPYVTHYLPPVKDFAVTKVQIPAGVSGYALAACQGASLLLTASGSGQYSQGQKKGQLVPGSVLFLSAGSQITLHVDKSSQENLLLFQAYAQWGH